MTHITILGDTLRALSTAHQIIDQDPEVEISIITDRAEIGLICLLYTSDAADE